jgi:hypothetical protein
MIHVLLLTGAFDKLLSNFGWGFAFKVTGLEYHSTLSMTMQYVFLVRELTD